MAEKIENYSTEKLKKEIKTKSWMVSIFGITIVYFSIVLVYDVVQGNEFDKITLFAIIAVTAGSSSIFLQRKKLIKELENRNSI